MAYKAVIICPGFEQNNHRSGLHWDTRLRTLAAATIYQRGLAQSVVAGAVRMRKMRKSFSALIKNELVRKHHIPESAIITEEYTFDAASEIVWLKEYLRKNPGKYLMVTDSAQINRLRELIYGYDLENAVDLKSFIDVIGTLHFNPAHLERFVRRLDESWYWKLWRLREGILAWFTRNFDPRGEIVSRFTAKRMTFKHWP